MTEREAVLGRVSSDEEEPPEMMRLPGLTLLGAPIDELEGDLTAREAVLVARAVPKRVREMTAGRILARRALVARGLAPSEILATADRAPIWPEGLTGSISHTDDYCAVALGPRELGHVGLDVESRGRLSDDLLPHVLVREEITFVNALEHDVRLDAATVLFCAKEAFYKAQYPRTGVILSFHDVTVRLAREGALEVRLATSVVGLHDRVFRGLFALATHRAWALVRLDP